MDIDSSTTRVGLDSQRMADYRDAGRRIKRLVTVAKVSSYNINSPSGSRTSSDSFGSGVLAAQVCSVGPTARECVSNTSQSDRHRRRAARLSWRSQARAATPCRLRTSCRSLPAKRSLRAARTCCGFRESDFGRLRICRLRGSPGTSRTRTTARTRLGRERSRVSLEPPFVLETGLAEPTRLDRAVDWSAANTSDSLPSHRPSCEARSGG